MTDLENLNTRPKKLPKQPGLVVPAIPGVLPFDGSRNPLTRSHTTRRVSMIIGTPATGGMPKVYHFDGEREMAVALEALLSGKLYRLEVQLPAISYQIPNKKKQNHHFDLRLTFKDGFRRGVYVKNGDSLLKRETHDEIDAIFAATPTSFADDLIVVNGDHYTRAYRDNLRRLWFLANTENDDADTHVAAIARAGGFWFMSDLIDRCDLPKAEAFRATMRLIGRGVIAADWHNVIGYQSKVWLAG